MKKIKRYIITSNDVFISIAGSIGVVGQVPADISGSNLTENAARIVIREGFIPRYLMYQLASGELQKQMYEKKIATTQYKLGLFRIKALRLAKPDMVEQTDQRVKDAQARVNHLTQSILAKAFRGELTADWREQNPDLISGENSAEALPARIKAEREIAKPGKQSQKLKAK